jgi:zinc protease
VGEFAVSGQFDAAETRKLAAELFGSWKSPGTYQRVPSMYRKVEPENNKIETPDKQNAMFVAGQLTKMSDEDPDYPAMILANYMMGGSSLGSRLFHRIRDKEGLSYGVQSQFGAPPKDDGASFIMVALSNPTNTPKVEASMKDELARTLKDGFTAEEVAAAQKSWLQERMVGRSEDGALVGLLAGRTRFDRTMEFDKALESKVASLTPDQISAAFRRHLDVAALTIVKAGDFKKAGVFLQ